MNLRCEECVRYTLRRSMPECVIWAPLRGGLCLSRKARGGILGLLMLLLAPCSRFEAQSVNVERLAAHRYSGASTADPLAFVNMVVLASDSSVLILDSESRLVHHVKSGVRTTAFGRFGAGPGELRSPTAIGTVGDSLWVSDSQLLRMTIFPLDGGGRSARQSTVAGLPGLAFASLHGYDGKNAMFLGIREGVRVDASVGQRAELYVREVGDGGRGPQARRLLLLAPGTRQMSVPVTINGAPYRAAAAQPFDPVPKWGAKRSGAGAVVVESVNGRESATGLRVRQWRGDGSLERSCLLPHRPRRLSPAIVESELQRVITPSGQSSRVKPDLDSLRRMIERPRMLPPARDAVFASDGTIWIRTDASFGDGDEEYLVVASEGCGVSRRVALPSRTVVHDARGDLFVTVSYVDLAPTVDLWRVEGRVSRGESSMARR